MSDPSDLAGESRSGEDAEFDRSAHPALGPFFAGLDELATPPPDADVRLQHIERAAAATGASMQPTPWRTVGWRVAAVAAGMAVVVGGLGADDRLPEPAQRMVSSVADAFGVELPDGSDRSTGSDDEDGDDEVPGTTGVHNDRSRTNSSTTGEDRRRQDVPRATPAEPGEPGEPATPADPANPDKPEQPDSGQPDTPATPQDRPAPTSPTPSSTVPPPPPSQPSSPPSNPKGADGGGNANESSDGNATEPPAPRSGADAAPDDADRGEISEKSTSKP